MGVKVTLDKTAVIRRVESASKHGTAIMANALLKDANYYCREDSGELERSAIRASKPEEGQLIWDTPYASGKYYFGTPVKDRNPNASLQWADKAAKEHREEYRKMLQKIIKGDV